jgi:hypothetical protein
VKQLTTVCIIRYHLYRVIYYYCIYMLTIDRRKYLNHDDFTPILTVRQQHKISIISRISGVGAHFGRYWYFWGYVWGRVSFQSW